MCLPQDPVTRAVVRTDPVAQVTGLGKFTNSLSGSGSAGRPSWMDTVGKAVNGPMANGPMSTSPSTLLGGS